MIIYFFRNRRIPCMGINWTPLTAAFYSLSRYCGGGLGRGFFARDARMEEPPPLPSPGEYAEGGKRARSLGIAVVLALLFLVTNSATAATYFVDQANPDANDQNTGTAARPWKTIGHAASEVRAGDRVIIRSGMYREGASIKSSGAPSKPIIFEADSHSRVVITGADLLTKWTKESDGTYSTPWSYVFVGWNPLHAHPDDSYHRLIGRCEQVFEMGYPLRQVLDRKEMARGTFFVDLDAKRLYVHTAEDRDFLTHSAPMEASSRQTIWDCRGDYVITRGLQFRYAANAAQQGAAAFSGQHDTIENCIFEKTNGAGATFTGQDIIVRGCTFRDNGQLGFGAGHAHRLLLSDCIITNNNTKGFNRDWEAGGDKIVLSRDVVIDRCQFIANRGHGIWFDIGNESATVRNSLIADNEDGGIFDEISYGLRATDNVIVGNGLAGTPGMWGASGGICLSSSPNSVIERNLLIANKEGISFREADRTTPRIDAKKGAREEAIWNHDDTIDHNVLAYNADAQIWGWFDTNDQRSWPKKMQTKAESAAAMSLESLALHLSQNLYAADPGRQLLHWGTSWRRNKAYGSMDQVRDELGLEEGSSTAAIEITDYASRDFRVPLDSPAIKLGCYPKGGVPGVHLGTSDEVRSSQGANP